MIGRTNAGGGGTALNYTVVGGTTEPTNPKENTVWVNTDTAITSYVFSSVEPASPAEGMVWIGTSTSATAPFNAIKKNGLWVSPTGAQQYISGSWVTKTAQTWQSGEWVVWEKVIYKNETVKWELVPKTGDYFTQGAFSEKTVSDIGQCLALESVSRATVMCISTTAIDVSGYSKIAITGTASKNLTTGGNYFDIRKNSSDDSRVAAISGLTGKNFSVEIPLSSPSIGVVYFCACAWCENNGSSYYSKLYITSVTLL